jgi:hypothetical protein
MIIDILTVILVLVAAFAGYRKGFIQPLLVELLSVGTLVFLLRHGAGYTQFMQTVFHANAFLAVVVALILAIVLGWVGGRVGGTIHRMPSVRGWDGLLGLPGQVLVATLFVYGIISGLIAIDRALSPAIGSTALTKAQVAQMQNVLSQHALTGWLAGNADFAALTTNAAKPGGAHLSEASLLSQVNTVYHDLLQPQLKSSRLAPWVMRVGQHTPFVGQYGARDLPPRSPTPSPTPSKAPASPKP